MDIKHSNVGRAFRPAGCGIGGPKGPPYESPSYSRNIFSDGYQYFITPQ